MKNTKVKFEYDTIQYTVSLTDVLGQRPGFTRTKGAINTFLANLSPALREKFGDYIYRLDGDRYDGYSIVAIDPGSPNYWWNETYMFHRTPASALTEWARNKCLI